MVGLWRKSLLKKLPISETLEKRGFFMMQGSMVALITPFTKDNAVDYPALKELIQWHIKEGTDAIVCLGTTGESPTINEEERRKIINLSVQTTKKRVPIIVGTGTNDTKKSYELTLQAKHLGADAALVIVPYYSKPSFRGCMAHFQYVAKAGLPIILYHHPGRTGIVLPVEIIEAMAKEKSIMAVKDSTCDLNYVEKLIKRVEVPILSGDDLLTIAMMQMGAKGVISVCANVIAKEIKNIVARCFAKEFAKAKEEEKVFHPLMKSLSLEVNPQGVKYAVSLLGKCKPFLRLPMIEPLEETKSAINHAMESISLMQTSLQKG